MANCFLPIEPSVRHPSYEHTKVAKKVKLKEYAAILLSRFSNKSSKHVPISSLLKKLANPTTSYSPAKNFSHPISEQGVKRIKVIITKQQLQELLSKKIQLEDVLTSATPPTLLPCDSTREKWKPELESIPEGYEL